MKHYLRARFVAFALLLAASAALAQTPAPAALPAGVTRGPTVEGITEYRLANGLRFILFPDPSKPTATVNITYLVGSRHENYGETGMAHLLEHLHLQGLEELSETRRGIQPARIPEQRLDLARSHELLLDLPGERRQPEVGDRLVRRRDGQLVHREEGSRLRDDGRAQRVRDGRERSRRA